MKEDRKYESLLHMDYPFPRESFGGRQRMALRDRVKIFAPFAALRGYEEAIAAKERIVVDRRELSEDSKEELDQSLQNILRQLGQGEHPVVTVVYFQKDNEGEKGEYVQVTGIVAKVLLTSRQIQIVERKILLDDVYEIIENER